MAEIDQLPVPDEATVDPQSFEIVRIWIANEAQHVSLRAGVWEDAAAWGILLADLARHVANCYEESDQMDGLSALKRIKEGFDAEMAAPTDDPTGEILP